jgi:hypothetical protein
MLKVALLFKGKWSTIANICSFCVLSREVRCGKISLTSGKHKIEFPSSNLTVCFRPSNVEKLLERNEHRSDFKNQKRCFCAQSLFLRMKEEECPITNQTAWPFQLPQLVFLSSNNCLNNWRSFTKLPMNIMAIEATSPL